MVYGVGAFFKGCMHAYIGPGYTGGIVVCLHIMEWSCVHVT